MSLGMAHYYSGKHWIRLDELKANKGREKYRSEGSVKSESFLLIERVSEKERHKVSVDVGKFQRAPGRCDKDRETKPYSTLIFIYLLSTPSASLCLSLSI